MAWQPDNPFITPTTGRWRQFANRCVRHVYADDGEIAVIQFPNVRTTLAADAFRAVGVRIKANSPSECQWRIHIAPASTMRDGVASVKYSAYTVVHIHGCESVDVVAKKLKYRKILGENIRAHRRNMQWSQEKLAEKASLHHNYIGDIERGEENVSVDALMRISAALKVSISDLVAGMK